jgi:AraC-like DNA-binding protein
MAESASLTFYDESAYTAAFGDTRLKLTITGPGDFTARLTRLRLQNLEIFWCSESVPRIAFISLPKARPTFTFVLGRPPMTICGFALRSGDVVFHSRGERIHQRSDRGCQWGLISLSENQFAYFSQALNGRRITSPGASYVLNPASEARLRFHRLFKNARRVAEVRKEVIANEEVVRALEEEALHAIVQCITGNDERKRNNRLIRRRSATMERFEDAVAKQIEGTMNTADLCTEIGVSERTLRNYCTQLLGVSPRQYALLRRLNKVRVALERADPSTASVSEIARDNQFVELGRLAANYRTAFGELPSLTLKREAKKLDN